MKTTENSTVAESNIIKRKPHKEYEDDYVIIENKEQFANFITHKYKIAWLNEKGKLCLKSYILHSISKTDKDSFVSLDVIKGDAQDLSSNIEDNTNHSDKIFDKKNLVWAGYMKPDEILTNLRLKEQNF
jgi:hypothetical protein